MQERIGQDRPRLDSVKKSRGNESEHARDGWDPHLDAKDGDQQPHDDEQCRRAAPRRVIDFEGESGEELKEEGLDSARVEGRLLARVIFLIDHRGQPTSFSFIEEHSSAGGTNVDVDAVGSKPNTVLVHLRSVARTNERTGAFSPRKMTRCPALHPRGFAKRIGEFSMVEPGPAASGTNVDDGALVVDFIHDR